VAAKKVLLIKMNLFVLLYITNFLRTLFYIVLIYYGIRFITRLILPIFVNKGIQQKMYEQQRPYQRNTRIEGEVTIESKNSNNRYSQQNQGEYVDFEEVE